jgi:predicted small lipoprotein YifL
VLRVAIALLTVTALAGCGSHDPPPRDPAPVRITIEEPADASVVSADTLELRGRVSPSRATVVVAGEPTPVSSGAFSATVALQEGANVIDVAASMPGRSSAFTALRVTYDPRVTVPDLHGAVDEEAADRLTDLGLDPSREAVGGLLDEFRGGPRRVCESEPAAGTLVEPGTDVVLRTSKRC